MNTTKYDRMHRLISSLTEMGFTTEEAHKLRRIQMTLHRWDELECGDSNDYASWAIERDETSGNPFMVTYPHTGKSRRSPIPDRETGAMKRAQAIVDARNKREFHPIVPETVLAFHQGDCRGCALYIVKASDIPDGATVESYYTRGVACCV